MPHHLLLLHSKYGSYLRGLLLKVYPRFLKQSSYGKMNVADTVTLPGLTVTNYNPTEVCHEPFKQPCYRTDQRNSGPYSSYGHRSRSCVLLSLPSHASVSSISGLGIILSNFVPLPLSAITMILNILLLIIGFLPAEKNSGLKPYTPVLYFPFSWPFLKESSRTSAP